MLKICWMGLTFGHFGRADMLPLSKSSVGRNLWFKNTRLGPLGFYPCRNWSGKVRLPGKQPLGQLFEALDPPWPCNGYYYQLNILSYQWYTYIYIHVHRYIIYTYSDACWCRHIWIVDCKPLPVMHPSDQSSRVTSRVPTRSLRVKTRQWWCLEPRQGAKSFNWLGMGLPSGDGNLSITWTWRLMGIYWGYIDHRDITGIWWAYTENQWVARWEIPGSCWKILYRWKILQLETFDFRRVSHWWYHWFHWFGFEWGKKSGEDLVM